MKDDEKNKNIILEEKRIKLGEYIKDTRLNKSAIKYGLNELAEAIGVTNSVISNLENGKIQKINPFLLQDIAEVLGIDYKILYKIVGFIKEDDPLIEEKLVKHPIPKELLEEKSVLIIWEGKKREILDLSIIPKKGLKDLKAYVEYLKFDKASYLKFLKWKKKQAKKEAMLDLDISEYLEKKEWYESSQYRIEYNENTVEQLFDKLGLKLNDEGKRFLERYIATYGDEEIEKLLTDENGKKITGGKKEYQLAKFVRKVATTSPIK